MKCIPPSQPVCKKLQFSRNRKPPPSPIQSMLCAHAHDGWLLCVPGKQGQQCHSQSFQKLPSLPTFRLSSPPPLPPPPHHHPIRLSCVKSLLGPDVRDSPYSRTTRNDACFFFSFFFASASKNLKEIFDKKPNTKKKKKTAKPRPLFCRNGSSERARNVLLQYSSSIDALAWLSLHSLDWPPNLVKESLVASPWLG